MGRDRKRAAGTGTAASKRGREPGPARAVDGETVRPAAMPRVGTAPWCDRTSGGQTKAPGHPGVDPTWCFSAKDGVGTALGSDSSNKSLIWFTLGRGILTEVYHPRVDQACIRDLGFVVSDGNDFMSSERDDAEHRVEYPAPGVPLYRLINACRRSRYRIEKTIFAHPRQDAILQVVRFTVQQGNVDDYHLYALLSSHLANHGGGNTAWLGEHRGVPMLFARRGVHALALACSAPWVKGSAGFAGVSDGRTDLSRNKRLTWEYDRAEDGNVVLTGEIGLSDCGGEFVLALGLGHDPQEAGHRALASLFDDMDGLRADYVSGWTRWQDTLSEVKPVDRQGRDLFRISAFVIHCHHQLSIPGAIVASLSTPWGEVRGDGAKEPGVGGYHLVWPRDLAEAAGGLLAAGAGGEALRVLEYLRATQDEDGHWPQNMWTDGLAFWTGIQVGETAFPLVLLGQLERTGLLKPAELTRYWPMVRKAASYILRYGASTQQDRWENEQGYTPYTLGVVISSLLIAAELADRQGEREVGTYLRETADAWNASIESWVYVTGTDLARRVGVAGYYARIIPVELGDLPPPSSGRPRFAGHSPDMKKIPAVEVVSPDALALVRFGLRAADDPRIVDTVKVIDAILKVDTPQGPSWRRYNGDGYGEHEDGSPFDLQHRGIGRAWPLLTGERAHYELAAGRRDEAIRLLHAMENFAGVAGMIPEQVWDADDIPEKGLFKGRPSGSAMPLVWAHAEYVKLLRSLAEGQTFDRPPLTYRRYVEQRTGSDRFLWRFDHQWQAIAQGKHLRVETKAPAVVHWSDDGGKSWHDSSTRDSRLGIHHLDLATADLEPGAELRFTFFWPEADRWEGKDFFVRVAAPESPSREQGS
jgi:glucoamylase